MTRATLAMWMVVVLTTPARADQPARKEVPKLTTREAIVAIDAPAPLIGLSRAARRPRPGPSQPRMSLTIL